MKTIPAIFAALTILWSGCAAIIVRKDIHLQIVNLSSRDMNNAEARFAKDTCPWGFVGRTSSAGYMFYRGEVTADAELCWWEEGRGQRVEKLDLGEALQSKESGTLVFSVADSGVKVHFEKDKKPNQPPQRNAGSRPFSDDSSASETPSSLGPRG